MNDVRIFKLVLSALLVSAVSAPLVAQEPTAFEPDDAGYTRTLQPFLRKYCVDCHGPDDPQGEFRVDRELPNDFLNLAAKGKWGEVVNVLNSHEMPPEDETQPTEREVSRVVDWITAQMARAELFRRDSVIVLRRLNRAEFRNTIRDLVGIDYDTSGFPQDSPAGGFDNNGGALTLSPLHLELYYDAAREILDRALVEGPRPSTIKWRFEPESGDNDSNRVEYDGQRLIVNGGKNSVENSFKVMHHDNWDRHLNARTFKLPHTGDYVIRIRAAGVVPTRDQVVATARPFLEKRLQDRIRKDPGREVYARREFDETLEHFRSDRMYDYGPPRLKLIRKLAGQPKVIAELDIDAPLKQPRVYEVTSRFTTAGAGLTIEYAYDIPKELENFWFQTGDDSARPELRVDWFEIEGPVVESWPPPSHRLILFESPLQNSDERAYARDVIARFMRRAWRRPVTDAEIDQKMELYDLVRDNAPSFVEAIKTPLIGVLISPPFLYLVEPAGEGQTASQRVASSGTNTGSPQSSPAIKDGVIPETVDPAPQTPKPEENQPLPFRLFTDKRGRKIRGRVLSLSGLKVRLERVGGQTFVVPLTEFAASDRAWIRNVTRPQRDVTSKTVPPTGPSPPEQRDANASGDDTSTAIQSAGTSTPALRRLTNHELASRLSYFLWSSMPDDELIRLANSRQLTDPAALTGQVERLLADPRSDAFVTNFAGQWLGLREVGSNPPAQDLYRRYDRHLEISIVKESLAFFDEILRNNLSVMNFVRSDFVVINERLGRFYGIPGVRGNHFRRVDVPRGVPRGGILTQASILSTTSNGTRTSPVKRGTWVMKNVLGIDPGLPVANAGEIAPKVPGLDRATVRQRLEIHRSLPQCARCHNKIDPLGFALENFDASGNWREREGHGYKGRIGPNDPLIDASSSLLDGTKIVGVSGLQDALMKQDELFLGCLVNKLMTYALGRELGIADQLHVKAAVRHMRRRRQDTLKSLITFVAASKPFLTK
jgi:mono/diheme cytochrome c family protein